MTSTLVIISGPTGSGKSTVVVELLKRHPDWAEVQSFTTRPRRASENERDKYIFVTKSEFEQQLKSGDILEHEEYAGNWYGTSRVSATELIGSTPVVIFCLNINGKEAVQKLYPNAIDIFLYVPDEVSRSRLLADKNRRGTDPIQQRARLAQITKQNEVGRLSYSNVVPNEGDISSTVDQVESIIEKAARANP